MTGPATQQVVAPVTRPAARTGGGPADEGGRPARTMLVFSGMTGVAAPLTELRELYARPEHTRFFRAAVEGIRLATEHVGPDAYPGQPELPLGRWLGGASADPAALRHSLVQGVLAHVYQLCLLQPGPGPAGRDDPAETAPVVAVGHSMGVQAAIAAGQRLGDRRTFLAFSRQSIALATLILLRCHQVTAGHRVDPALVDRYHRRAGATAVPPAMMASVLSIGEADLRAAVTGHNERGLAAPVEIAIVNSARSHVLAGTPDALAEFWLAHADRFAGARVRWSFLSSTAPFHSRLLDPAARLLRQDRSAVPYDVRGEQLALPVYVAEPPANLQDRADLFDDFLEQAICRPVDWFGTVAGAVAACRPEQVVDFGPGPAARLFTRESLRAIGRDLPYRMVAPGG